MSKIKPGLAGFLVRYPGMLTFSTSGFPDVPSTVTCTQLI